MKVIETVFRPAVEKSPHAAVDDGVAREQALGVVDRELRSATARVVFVCRRACTRDTSRRRRSIPVTVNAAAAEHRVHDVPRGVARHVQHADFGFAYFYQIARRDERVHATALVQLVPVDRQFTTKPRLQHQVATRVVVVLVRGEYRGETSAIVNEKGQS